MDFEELKSFKYRKRWFCYFDLLGFTALVQNKGIEQVMPIYQKALSLIERVAETKKTLGISCSWFSDSFIIYSQGGQDGDFAHLEQAGRLFFQELILHQIPVRGALTFGELYTQAAKNIYIGPALIDAYCYAEKQDRLGFVLTPSVSARLEDTSIPASHRSHYRLVNMPGIINHQPSAPIYAFAFNNGMVNGKNPYISALNAMKLKAPDYAKEKYARSIAFLEQHCNAPS